MIKFKKLELEDKELIDGFLKRERFNSYEYTFGSLFLWKKVCNVEYAIIDEVLIIKKEEEGKGMFFLKPIGYKKENLKQLVCKLNNYSKDLGNFIYLFREIEEDFLEELKEAFYGELAFSEEKNDAEYLYNVEELVELKGKKYHSKKNHYNSFVKNYVYDIKNIANKEVIEQCLELLDKWKEGKNVVVRELVMEKGAIEDCLVNLEKLNMKGIAVYVNENIAGFTFGHEVNDESVTISIEKGDIEYKGIYAFMNRELLAREFKDYKIVNRQEDCGVEGLIKAKQSYYPIDFVRKYRVRLEL